MIFRLIWGKKPGAWRHVSNVFQLLDKGKGTQLAKLIEKEQREESEYRMALEEGALNQKPGELQSDDHTIRLKRVGSFPAK